MTGQRMWVRTIGGDVIAVDQIERYAPEEGAATGHTVLTVHAASDWRGRYVGPFVSERAALDFARRHFGPVVDPAGLSVADEQRDASRSDEVSPTADRAKHDPPSAAELHQQQLDDGLDAAIARGREAQREAGLRLDGPETA